MLLRYSVSLYRRHRTSRIRSTINGRMGAIGYKWLPIREIDMRVEIYILVFLIPYNILIICCVNCVLLTVVGSYVGEHVGL